MMTIPMVMRPDRSSLSSMRVYRVGGYVRDKLLGLSPNDCDYVVVGSSIQEMLQLGYIQVGKAFPVFIHPTTHEEYALARTEKKEGCGHLGFIVYASPEITLEEDLSRRDLTINAIAEDMDGKLIDPYGGISDLHSGVLRHVSLAFKDDPLRILRVARFAARFDFVVAPATLALLSKMAKSKEGQTISRERIVNELRLALNCNYAINFFTILRKSNNLAVFFSTLNKDLSADTIWAQFSAELHQCNTYLKRLVLISCYLPRHDLALRIHELTLIKQEHKFIRHANLLYHCLFNLDLAQNVEDILTIYKQFDIWRNFDSFINLITNFQQLLVNIPRLSKFTTKLEQIELLAKTLKELSLEQLLRETQDKAQLVSAIHNYQIATITQFQSCIVLKK